MNINLLFSPLTVITCLLIGCTQPQQQNNETKTDSENAKVRDTIASVLPAWPVPKTIMTEDYVEMVGEYAYLWGLANGEYS